VDTARKAAEVPKELCMATCEVCENEYDKAFEVVVAGKHHTFDSFECAIHALPPVCPRTAIVGSWGMLPRSGFQAPKAFRVAGSFATEIESSVEQTSPPVHSVPGGTGGCETGNGSFRWAASAR
jgi:hypothetical protein